MRDSTYKARLKRLKAVHNFTFDARQKLTRQRKAAITKQWNQHGDIINKIEQGIYEAIPATKTERKFFGEQYPVTNKVIIYNKKIDPDTKRKTKIIGKGKNRKLLDDIKIKSATSKKMSRKLTLYLKFPEGFRQSDIDEYIMSVWQELKPDYVSVAINGYSGNRMITPKSFGKYGVDLAKQINKKKGTGTAKEVITGIYLIYFRAAYSTKWLENLKDKINDFQNL